MTMPPQTVARPLKVLVVAATVDDRWRLLYAMDTGRGVEVVIPTSASFREAQPSKPLRHSIAEMHKRDHPCISRDGFK